jgi:hypothetical protein
MSTSLTPATKLARILRWSSYLLVVVAVATCQIGTRYEKQKIFGDARAGIPDTDWIGFEWALWSALILCGAVVLRMIALMVGRLKS